MTKETPLQVGCLVLSSGVQLLDMAPIDLFGMLSKEYLTACKLPAAVIAHGLDVKIHYISDLPSDTTNKTQTVFAECTAGAAVRVTAFLEDKEVQPGKLDILMIPGPNPSAVFEERVLGFIRKHAQAGTTVMSVCTGIFPLSASGSLEGRKATAPRALIPDFKKSHPGVTWAEKRWVKDGNIWSSGGITNGIDMVAAFLKERYPGVLSDIVCTMADVGDRGETYTEGQVRMTGWWLWMIIRAVFKQKKT